MMTLMKKLLALCAAGTLCEMVIGEKEQSGLIRLICGMLMLTAALEGIGEAAEGLSGAGSLQAVWAIFLR